MPDEDEIKDDIEGDLQKKSPLDELGEDGETSDVEEEEDEEEGGDEEDEEE